MNSLINFDHQLFYFINNGLTNNVFDLLLPLLRNKYFWIPLYLAIIGFFIIRHQKLGYIAILFLILSVGIADFTSAGIIKKIVKRDRPCNNLNLNNKIITRVDCGKGYSFPSTHATDHFAIAAFMITLFKRNAKYVMPLFIFWALMIGFSQIYVGVHFPLDVLCGSILGYCIGYFIANIFLSKFNFQTTNAVL